MLASTWFDPVIGLDIHTVLLPPLGIPTPMPMPFVGMVFDPLGLAIGVGINCALGGTAGLVLVNDLSEREYQLERGGQWDKGKGCDTFGPFGPWLVTLDEVDDLGKLDLWLDLNGKRVQTGNTDKLIFDVATVVSYVSQFMSLQPGDIISTGTPPGVGMGMKPPLFLKEGDVMELGITGLGVQRQQVKRWPG
jgi:2-keto-4-pentenoate hydratase/2-oxohepta-3-ene-1,7-dioic acid hydratase in catechol pathway